MRHLLSIILFGTISLVTTLTLGQDISQSATGCVVKETIKPAVFISYETRSGTAETLLRLHNNTSCEIIVEIEPIDPLLPKYNALFIATTQTWPNGIVDTHFVSNPPEGAEVPIFYDRQRNRRRLPEPGNYRRARHLTVEYSIPGGRSVTFPVNSKTFGKRRIISVPFSYQWEHNHDVRIVGTVKHRVYYFYDMPRGYPRPCDRAAQQIVGPEPREATFASSVIRLSCSVAPRPGQLRRWASSYDDRKTNSWSSRHTRR